MSTVDKFYKLRSLNFDKMSQLLFKSCNINGALFMVMWPILFQTRFSVVFLRANVQNRVCRKKHSWQLITIIIWIWVKYSSTNIPNIIIAVHFTFIHCNIVITWWIFIIIKWNPFERRRKTKKLEILFILRRFLFSF